MVNNLLDGGSITRFTQSPTQPVLETDSRREETRGYFSMNLAPEDQLLICCCRAQMSAVAVREASELLQQPLDWDYLLEASIAHGVSPLFYFGLQQVLQPSGLSRYVPSRVLEQLHKFYRRNESRNYRDRKSVV